MGLNVVEIFMLRGFYSFLFFSRSFEMFYSSCSMLRRKGFYSFLFEATYLRSASYLIQSHLQLACKRCLQLFACKQCAPQDKRGERDGLPNSHRAPNAASRRVVPIVLAACLHLRPPTHSLISHATHPEGKKLDLRGFSTPQDRENRAFGTI